MSRQRRRDTSPNPNRRRSSERSVRPRSVRSRYSMIPDDHLEAFTSLADAVDEKYNISTMYDPNLPAHIFGYMEYLYDTSLYTIRKAIDTSSIELLDYVIDELNIQPTPDDIVYAIASHKNNILKHLMERDVSSILNESVLQNSILYNNFEMISFLLLNGAEYTFDVSDYVTSLDMIAFLGVDAINFEVVYYRSCVRGNLELVKYCLEEKSVDPKYVHFGYASCISEALRHFDLVEYIINYIGPDNFADIGIGESLLFCAYFNNIPYETIRYIIMAGAVNPDDVEVMCRFAMKAIRVNDLELVKFMVENHGIEITRGYVNYKRPMKVNFSIAKEIANNMGFVEMSKYLSAVVTE